MYKFISKIIIIIYIIILFNALVSPFPSDYQIKAFQYEMAFWGLTALSHNINIFPFHSFSFPVYFDTLRHFLIIFMSMIPVWYLFGIIFERYHIIFILILWLLLSIFNEFLQFTFGVYFWIFYRDVNIDDVIFFFFGFIVGLMLYYGIYKTIKNK